MPSANHNRKDDGPIRVLMIAPTSFFSDYGCHVRILEESKTLGHLGHQVTVVTYRKGRAVDNINIVRTPPLPWRADYEVGSSRHKIAFDIFLFFTVLWAALRTRPHVIHGHLHEGALIGWPIAKLLGIPLVFDLQGSLTGEMVDHHFLNPDGLLYGPMRLLESIINKLPSTILTSTLMARDMLIEEFGVDESRILPFPDCVTQESFAPDNRPRIELKQHLGIPQDRPVVVYLGLLADYQGTPTLLHSAALLKENNTDAHFLIMGYPVHERYRQLVENLGISDRVTLTGKIPYNQAADYLSVGDVAVAPKVSATEGSGKVLNYMAMGIPVVATDTPVHREYLQEMGVYAPPGDVRAFASGIEELLLDTKRRQQMGPALRKRVLDEYSWDTAGIKLVDIYRRIIQGA